jgi:predicted acyl esterase
MMDGWPENRLPSLRVWLEHRTDDDYRRSISLEPHHGDTDLPVLHLTSWFDSFLDGTLRDDEGMVAAGHPDQRLVVGPWTHHVPMAALGSARAGDFARARGCAGAHLCHGRQSVALGDAMAAARAWNVRTARLNSTCRQRSAHASRGFATTRYRRPGERLRSLTCRRIG